MNHLVVALKVHDGVVTFDGEEIKMKLPDGCMGILFCFESKKAAREYWGKDISLQKFEFEQEKI